MAPTRKSRSVNRRFSNFKELSPNKDAGNSAKNKARKKKLSDMLGPQWSKDELQCFYEAFRKYGKDWKKVSFVVRNRSIEMVEALYNMNRAYLSLPEGTASVVGLIAMMTDHYNVLEGSESDRESDDGSAVSRRSQKRGRGKLKEDFLQPQSSDGCLSLLKKRRTDGRAFGKRTPRFPVSYSYRREDGENHVSPSKRGQQSGLKSYDDEGAHVAALALTEASQRGDSPQLSQTPYGREKEMKPSLGQSEEGMHSQSETAWPKIRGATKDEEILEGSLGSRGVESGDNARDSSSYVDMEGVGTVEVHRMGKKYYGKKTLVENTEDDHFDDGREACSGTEEGLDTSVMNGSTGIESPLGQRKRIKKLQFEDESPALDALLTLADLSLMMPASAMESESSFPIKGENRTVDAADKSLLGESLSSNHQRENPKNSWPKDKTFHLTSGVEGITSRKSKVGREPILDMNTIPDVNRQSQSADKTWKRKRRSSMLKDIAEEENKSAVKVKCNNQMPSPLKPWKSVRPSEHPSPNTNQRKEDAGVAAPIARSPSTDTPHMPAKPVNKRKSGPRRMRILEMNTSSYMVEDQATRCSIQLHEGALDLKGKLSSCLSSYMVRRWCIYEWFYCALDYPWYAKSEFVEYLKHARLGHIPRLTRDEWGVIRSSLGKPRRFSERLLLEEKEKLNQYRESVRKHYSELRIGTREGLPTDLARPLTVGQRVIALHPRTREVHDGSVLTVDYDRCRIQFDRPEIGVEFVKDIDCMPVNPLENMPEAMRRQHMSLNSSLADSTDLRANIQTKFEKSIMSLQLENGQGHSNISSVDHHMDTKPKQTQEAAQICSAAQIQAREADVRALCELTRALDKKEALLVELRNANNDVLEDQNDGDGSLKDFEPFKKHYATVFVQLKEASEQVSSALLFLRQRNTYPGNSLPTCLKPPTTSDDPIGLPDSLDNSVLTSQEAGFNVAEIVKGSKLRAHAMVDAAIQAMSSMKEGEGSFARIEDALNFINKWIQLSDSGVSSMKHVDPVNGDSAHQCLLTSSVFEPLVASHAGSAKLHDDGIKSEAQVPSELIASCVATLLMIQACTERHCPPSDVAQILDSAVTSLHPYCPQNLPIYREIQMCIGRIKTQIIALIPT